VAIARRYFEDVGAFEKGLRGLKRYPYTVSDKKVFDNILEAIGHTPMVRINSIARDVKGTVYAKIETTNPGNSIKDRMAVQDDRGRGEERRAQARRDHHRRHVRQHRDGAGHRRPSSRATAASSRRPTSSRRRRRTRCGPSAAEVIVCPTNVEPEDPAILLLRVVALEKEVPNSWKANQYDNPSNAAAHYDQTGPEIWQQTGGMITHLVCGVGTGGTISGVGKFLKEKNPKIRVWGIDTYGSVLKKYKDTGVLDKNEIYPYITEGIGEDFLPKNVDFSVIDYFEKVTDKDAALMTRRITREEGIFAGNSAGSAMAGLLQLKDNFRAGDVVVVIFHDHGTRYLGKMFQRRLDAREGLLREERHDRARPGRLGDVGRAPVHRREPAGGRRRTADEANTTSRRSRSRTTAVWSARSTKPISTTSW
jgi:cystathionine beta-synthase